MALVDLSEAKNYLRVDSADDDALISVLLTSAERLCVDVGRLNDERWEAINKTEISDEENISSEDNVSNIYTEAELEKIRSVMKIAVLYALGYFYEHREEADYHELTLTLRCILFAVREGENF